MESSILTPSNIGLRFHLGVYRACSNGISSLAINALKAASIPIQYSRQLTLVDAGCTFTLLTIDKAIKYLFNKNVFDPETLQSKTQKQQQREIAHLSMQAGPSCSVFAYETARFVNEFIPSYIGKQLETVPLAIEGIALYRSGMFIRYVNHQVKYRTDYRNKIIQSEYGKKMERLYAQIRTCTAYLLTGETVLSQFVNSEQLILHLILNFKLQLKANQSVPWVEAAIHSIATSSGNQRKIDEFLLPFRSLSCEQQFIARLKWHADNNCLPEGLPDYRKERISPQNLQQKSDEALNIYLKKSIGELVSAIFPKAYSGFSSVIGTAFELEGKQMIIDLITYLTSEFMIKQIADPHLFALAILKSFGKETLSFETDGFGQNKEALVFQTGLQISKSAYNQTHVIYNQSLLRQDPAGLEGIMQKEAAKRQLRECLAEAIYQTIKTNEEFKHPGGILKTVREKMGQMPVIGTATTGLHLLISGSLYSLGYLFRRSEDNTSFLTFLFRHLTGKKLADYLADRILELIYHPSWRIIMLQLINDLIHTLKHPADVLMAKSDWPQKDFHQLTQFVFHHFNQGSPVPFQKSITSKIDGKAIMEQLTKQLANQEDLIDKTLGALTPTIKELLLYVRVTDIYRKEGAVFEGDAKFWEVFVREWLNRRSLQRRSDDMNRAPPAEYRKTLVEELLALHGEDLRSALSKTLEDSFVQAGGIPEDLLTENYFGARASGNSERPALRIVQD